MKVLVIGAGVIGSFYAARLTDGGADVTLLARGRRLADLREHGVVLESALGGRRTVTRVPLAGRLDPDEEYDLAVVVVRRSQIPSVLPMLAANRRIPAVLFLGNNAGGPDDMIAALGRQRVLTGFVVAGGERRGMWCSTCSRAGSRCGWASSTARARRGWRPSPPCCAGRGSGSG